MDDARVGFHIAFIQMSKDKMKAFWNKCDVLYSREDNSWMGQHSILQTVEYCSLGILGKGEHYRMSK